MLFFANYPQYKTPVYYVNIATLADGEYTNNLCEAWNKSFFKLVGYKHPSVWRIESLKKDNHDSLNFRQPTMNREFPLKKEFYKTKELQQHLKTLCSEQKTGQGFLFNFFFYWVRHTVHFY